MSERIPPSPMMPEIIEQIYFLPVNIRDNYDTTLVIPINLRLSFESLHVIILVFARFSGNCFTTLLKHVFESLCYAIIHCQQQIVNMFAYS